MRIVYVSRCMLNQNLRFPGIAVEKGALTELIVSLIKEGIGIEPLPCLERLGWGGVRRKTFFKYFPIVSKYLGSIFLPIIKVFLRNWLRNYRKLCKKEAKKIILQILDYNESGYSILGVITMNDSPTCGFNKTINLLRVITKSKEKNIIFDAFKSPSLNLMKDLIPGLCEKGSGYFITELITQMKKSNLSISVIGFDVWNNLEEETENVVKKLNLHNYS